jgi:serralysin
MTSYDWISSNGGDFDDPANWLNGDTDQVATTPPGAGDTAFIDASVNITMHGDTVQYIECYSNTEFSGSFNVTTLLDGGIIENGTVSAATFQDGTVDGGTVSAGTFSNGTVSGGIVNAGSMKSVTVNGGTVSAATMNSFTVNSGTVSGGTISGGTLNGGNVDAAILELTTASGGTVEAGTIGLGVVIDGAFVTANQIGSGAGVTVSSGTLAMSSAVLQAGNGILDFATVTAGGLVVGGGPGPLAYFDVAGSQAQATVSGSASILAGGEIAVGRDTIQFTGATGGSLTIAGNLTISTDTTFAGMDVESGGTVSVGGSALVAETDVTPASITVNGAGAVLHAGNLTVGNAVASAGMCNSWSYAGPSGLLTVSNGGYVAVDHVLSLENPGVPGVGLGLVIQAGGGVEVGGSSSAPHTHALQIDSGGTLVVEHGILSYGTILDNGTIEAASGRLVISGGVAGTGSLQIDSNSILELTSSFSGTVTFNNSTAGAAPATKLRLDDPTHFSGTIGGLAVGNTIELVTSALPASVKLAHTQIIGSTLDLTLSNNQVWSFNLSGSYQNDCFTISTDVDGNKDLTLEPASPMINTGVNGAPTSNVYLDSLIAGWADWSTAHGPITYWFGSQSDIASAIQVHGATAELNWNTHLDNWTAQEQADFKQALQDYSDATGLVFVPASSAATANLVWWLDPAPFAGTNTGGRSDTPGLMPDGHLWQYFDDTKWTADPNRLAFGGTGLYTIIHELGHALGLAHPQDGGPEPGATTFPGVTAGLGSYGLNQQNQGIYTVMSYNQGWTGQPRTTTDYGSQGALGAFDIAALQKLYGKNTTTNSGDNTYMLPSVNTSVLPAVNVHSGTNWSSIWDTGGNNTISNANSNLPCTIDLRAAPLTGANAGGYVSYVHGIQGGFTIANGVVVQNAVGGGGNDLLIGGTGNETFEGGGGNDRIIGGAGVNTAIYTGKASDYTWSENTDGSFTITDNRGGSPDGTDTLQNIQNLQFADETVPLQAALIGPTIAIHPIDGDDVLNATDTQSPLTIDGITTGAAGQTLTVTFNGSTYTTAVANDGTWSVVVPQTAITPAALPDGTYTVKADVTDSNGNPAPEATETLTVDQTLPRVVSVVTSPSGTARTGQTVFLTLNLSEAVTVSQDSPVDDGGGVVVPTLSFNDGGTASYTSGGGTNALTFAFMVQQGDQTSDLQVTGFATNDAIIYDSAGNDISVSLAGTSGTDTGLQIISALVVNSGQTVNVSSGQTSNGAVVLSGGTLNVLSGGTASGTLVSSGGFETVAGTGSGATVAGGGVIELESGGTASGTIVSSGGTLELLPGSIVSGTTQSSGSFLEIASGYSLTNYVASGGVSLMVGAGGSASGATVSSGYALDVLDGGTLQGAVVDNGTVNYDVAGSATFGGTLTGSGTLVVSGGGSLDVLSAYTGSAQIDHTSTLEFASTYVGAATFSGSSTGSAGMLKFDSGSTGPITVVNSSDAVIAQPGGNNWIDAIVSYTLPTNVDALFLYAGAQGTGNSDPAGDALYALNTGPAQTQTGNSANDTFVVYNSSDVVVPKTGSHDAVYAAASYTLPTGVDVLYLEAGTQGTGNSDAAGDALWAVNPGQVATLTGNSANDAFVVYNSSDVVVPKAGSHDTVYSAVNYTLPTGVDVLFLEAGTQGTGNSDAASDVLYAANAGIAQTLTGNGANDTFVVYNSADVVAPKAGSHDTVYSAVNYTLPTGVDGLLLEAGTQGVGNSDVAGDVLYAADAGIAQTLTGESANDSFVAYNSADVVVGQSGSTDKVYAAANFTLPTNVDTLLLEGNASHGNGNSDAVDALFGNGGVASTLVAGSGADTLYVTGTAGTILTGGVGHDTFAFPNVMGHDEVTNFGLAKDTLQFNMTLFSNFTAAMNHASQSGANTVFTIDANDTVTLDNITKTSLTAGNFHFS